MAAPLTKYIHDINEAAHLICTGFRPCRPPLEVDGHHFSWEFRWTRQFNVERQFYRETREALKRGELPE